MNFNREPYYDDFDPDNKYYKILFKPGYAVQARELNQIQSIAQHQLNGISNHIFKKNTMVIPGGVILNTGADLVRVNSTSGLDTWVGQTITNAPTTNPVGYISAVVLAYGIVDNNGYLYVKYFSTQTTGTTKSVFAANDVIRKVDAPTAATLTCQAVSIGKVATVAAGVYYTKELFVDVDNQSIIVEPTTDNVTNCQIVLKINESIVTSDTDESLLDNAQGSPNYAAPGADRYKVELTLQKHDLTTVLDDEQYITLMQVENDIVTLLNNNTQYAELMKTLARRTYDANGNFIVSGLNTTVNESSDDDYVWANVGKGRCYLGGYEYDQIADVPIALEKPRTNYTETAPSVRTFAEGLTYFYVAGGTLLKEIPVENTLIRLLNAKPGASGVATIGYAVFKDIQYVAGTVGSTDYYKMFFDIVDIEKGYGLEDVGGYLASSTEGSAILHELTISNKTGAFTASQEITSTTDSSQLADIHFASDNVLYVVKKSTNAVPNTDTIKNNTVAATAFLNTSFISNLTDTVTPLIKVDDVTIQTLLNGSGNSTVTYSYVKRFEWSVPASNGSSTSTTFNAGAGEEFEDFSNTDYNVFITTPGSESFVDYSSFSSMLSLNSAATTLTMTVPTGNTLRGKTIYVYATILVNQSAQTAKTLQTTTVTIANPSRTRNVWTALKHQDVVEIVKIVDSGATGTAPNLSTHTDITSKYILDSGNYPGFVGTGMIKLKKGATPPVGQIGIQYRYYSVSAQDYVSVDSYGDYTGDLSYIGNIKDIVDRNRNVIKTRQYLDFRTTTSNVFFKNYGEITSGSTVLKLKNVNLSSLATELVGKYVLGPHTTGTGVVITSVSYNDTTGDTEIVVPSAGSTKTGTYYIGLNSSLSITATSGAGTVAGTSYSFPKDGARLAYTHKRFTSRKVLVYINRDNDVITTDIMDLDNISEAVALRRNAYKLPLAFLDMPPYTVNASDIKVTKFENPVYQMLDIHDLKGRIERNEYYTSLALNVDIAEEIIDAQNENLTVAGKGFWNENFMNLNTQAINSPDFACTVYDKSYVAPGTVFNTINLNFDSSNTYNAVTSNGKWQRTGNAITLPYVEQRAFGNDRASRSNNLNPYNVMNWSGKMVLNPSVDNWVDIQVEEIVVTNSPPVVPAPPVEEIVTEINNLRTSWGPDSAGGKHAITFDWKTNLGRTGRVNTDWHLSPVIKNLGGKDSPAGKAGYNGVYAQSLINRKYNDTGVKEYLNAGTHFDQKPPNKW